MIAALVDVLKEWWLDDPLVFVGGFLVAAGIGGLSLVIGGAIVCTLPWWGTVLLFATLSLIAGIFVLQKSGETR